jgi:hypothetical protein
MNLFRSEEHVRRWVGDRDPGMTLPVSTLAALAEAWWGDRLAPDWTPHSRAHNQSILDGLGLTGEPWTLP